jgi:threonine/homoserine/homoserine lactone efflux protein
MLVWQTLGQAVVLGLGAGITPGPLLGLIINETLRGGWQAGVLVALAPLIADAVIIGLTFTVLLQLPSFVFPLLGIIGGCYVIFMGWETLRTASTVSLPMTGQAENAENTQNARSSLYKGLMVNMLNPHPYLFWLTVGGPLISRLSEQSAWSAIVAFLGGFYGCLVGSKIVLAVFIHTGRTRLQGRGYRLALQVSGMLLLLFGGMLVWGGGGGLMLHR